jgi:hypothetical protein
MLFIKFLASRFALAAIVCLMSLKAFAFFRHTSNLFNKKEARYGTLSLLAPRSIQAENLYALGITPSSVFSQSVLAQMDPKLTTSKITTDSQNIGASIAFGKKTNSAFRYDFSLAFAQARKFLITTPTTYNLDSQIGSAGSSQARFDNVDVLVRYYNAMFNGYLDTDVNRFRFYLTSGIGFSAMSAALRGNMNMVQNSGTNQVSTDSAQTLHKIRGLGLDGMIGTGVQIGFNKNLRFDIFYKQFFTIAKLISSDRSLNGVDASQPAKHKVTTLGIGMVLYFD